MTNGTDEKTQIFIWTAVIAAITGIYGFFIKHIVGHSDKQYIDGEVQALWNKKQDISVCKQIVERIDQNHKEIKEDLTEIKNLIRNGGKDK